MEKYSDTRQIRNLLEWLVKSWEKADLDGLEERVIPDAWIDFSMFDRGISVAQLKQALSTRARKTEFARFEIYNYVGLADLNNAQQIAAVIGVYADPNNGKWTRFGFEGTFANTLQKTKDGWKFSAIRFELGDETSKGWARLHSTGIKRISASTETSADISYVSNWKYPYHDDRIGWYPDSRIPPITAEMDAPWNAIQNCQPRPDEEQIQEAFFRYAFGIDFNCFKLYDGVFTEDAMIVYADEQCRTVRQVIDLLKPERQGSSRCLHTGFFTKIIVAGDTAEAYLYLRGVQAAPDGEITKDYLQSYRTWSRYKLFYKRCDGNWKIHKLYFYPGDREWNKIPDFGNAPKNSCAYSANRASEMPKTFHKVNTKP